MNVAIFSWRDLDHPKAGGAEVITHHAAEGLAARGHSVTVFASRFGGAAPAVERAGYRIVRAGSEFSCRFRAARWLRARAAQFDVVVDEVNTLPFFSPWITPQKTILLIFQLAREVWLAEAPPLVGWIGYLLEPLYLRIYRNTPIITISDSSAATLKAIGLRGRARIIEVPIDPPSAGVAPNPIPGRIGYVGRIAPSKRIDHIIRALAIVRRARPDAELIVVGKGSAREVERLRSIARALEVADWVRFTGSVSDAQRDAAMARFDLISMTSLREGWGMAISEAARFRVPAVVYPVPGLVDSTRNGETGIVCERCDPQELAAAMQALLGDRARRDSYGRAAQEFAKELTVGRLVDRYEAAFKARASGSWSRAAE